MSYVTHETYEVAARSRDNKEDPKDIRIQFLRDRLNTLRDTIQELNDEIGEREY